MYVQACTCIVFPRINAALNPRLSEINAALE